ncbi:MAG: trypsin-like serine peptidase, partial [Candidatus Promineifilaceae bacterium]
IAPEYRQATWEVSEKTGHLIHGYGTGWILGSARKVLITNNHVLPLREAARGAMIEFGYERTFYHGTRARYNTKLRPDHLFLTDPNMAFGGLDYTVVALSRPAPEEFGYLDAFQGITANNALNIYIVQHPGGSGKAYVLNHNSKVNLPDRYVTYVSDTLEGSSGSPLFNDEGDLVGIHHLGNYEAKIGTKTQTDPPWK